MCRVLGINSLTPELRAPDSSLGQVQVALGEDNRPGEHFLPYFVA